MKLNDDDIAKAVGLIKQLSDDLVFVRTHIEAISNMLCNSAHTQDQNGQRVSMIQVKAR